MANKTNWRAVVNNLNDALVYLESDSFEAELVEDIVISLIDFARLFRDKYAPHEK